MSLFTKTRPHAFNIPSVSKEVAGRKMNSFSGHIQTANKLSQPFGQLALNKNMEYWYSGDNVYLRTKRGSNLILDITSYPYGGSIYNYNRGSEYLVWVDGSDIKYSDFSGTDAVSCAASLTESQDTRFIMYGQDTESVMYGVNGVDPVFRLTGSVPVYGAISGAPILTDICFSTMSGRLMGVVGHKFYATEIQTGSGYVNLEDWTELNTISPDSGGGFKRIIDLGIFGVYMFKDTGIWVLPDPSQELADWAFPKCQSDVGTNSPNTVCQVTYGGVGGVIFLASDKTLRLFAPEVQYNAGTIPTVTSSVSKIISEPFQEYLDDIPDGFLDKCVGCYYDRTYVLNICSANGTDIDTTIVIDCEKLIQGTGDKIAQPYWYLSENMDYTKMAVRTMTKGLYGFNKNGYITKMFVDNIFYEEMPTRITVTQEYADDTTRRVAIEYNVYTAWFDYSQQFGGSELEVVRGYLNWETLGNWGLGVCINSFLRGESIPEYSTGNTNSLTSILSGAIFDLSLFDYSYFAYNNASASQNINVGNKGHYFSFGFYGTGLYQAVAIYGVEPIFRAHRMDSTGKR